jgi:hypothetical protein
MRGRGLLVAAGLLAILGGAYYYENNKKPADPKPDPDAPPKLITLSTDQARQIEVHHKDETTVIQRDSSGKWQISAPTPLSADQAAASQIATSLADLTWDRLIEDKPADLSGFGLVSPSSEVMLTTKDGKTRKLLIGDETPTGGTFFAKLDGDPRVFTIGTATKNNVDKTWKDLRDKRLLTFDQDKLTRIELTAKNQQVELGKNNRNEWQILKPKPLRADGFAVEEVLRKLKDASMDPSVSAEDSKKAAASFGYATRVATVKFTDNTGTQQLEVRKDAKANAYYARSSAVEGVHKVSDEIGQGVDKGIDDFRNKKLFDFGFTEPGKVEMHDGTKTYVFQKSGEKWTSNGKQLDSTSVQAFLDKLRDLASIKFVDRGFTTPIIDITVTAKNGEKVLISKTGNTYIAKRDNEPALYELDGKAVEQLQSAASAVK